MPRRERSLLRRANDLRRDRLEQRMLIGLCDIVISQPQHDVLSVRHRFDARSVDDERVSFRDTEVGEPIDDMIVVRELRAHGEVDTTA